MLIFVCLSSCQLCTKHGSFLSKAVEARVAAQINTPPDEGWAGVKLVVQSAPAELLILASSLEHPPVTVGGHDIDTTAGDARRGMDSCAKVVSP